MMVSMKGAMKTLAAPMVTAPSALKKSRISGVQRGQEMRKLKPCWRPAQSMKNNWPKPPASTPQAAAYAALGSGGGMGMPMGAPGAGQGQNTNKGKRPQHDERALYTEDRPWTAGIIGNRPTPPRPRPTDELFSQ